MLVFLFIIVFLKSEFVSRNISKVTARSPISNSHPETSLIYVLNILVRD